MKKISCFLSLIFLFGCQSLQRSMQEKAVEIATPTPQTHNQFESRNLNTSKVNQKKIKVALFLPFSGKNKELGWHLYNAATLSLFENDVNNNIELVLVDSKDDSPKQAAQAFKEIVNNNIKLVIGPVFSQTAQEIKNDVKQNKITAISFSNNQKLIGEAKDGAIFIAGFAPEPQIDKIISYAIGKGKFNFAIIAPNNQYGRAIADITKSTVKSRDGIIIASELYDASGKDLEKSVARAINAFEISSKLIDPKTKKAKKDVTITTSDRSYPQVIMIPESGKTLSKIAAIIKQLNKDEKDFQLIGSNQWDDISTLNDYNLVGGLFASPENEKFRNFESAYYQLYNKFPPRIASIAYDSVAVIAELIDKKQRQTPTTQDFILYVNPSKNGFEGIDGLFRFLPNSSVQRSLAVLRVGSGKFETIEKPNPLFLKYKSAVIN